MTPTRTVLLVLLAATALRLPFLGVLPSPDEAGLLIIGEQWTPGDSLYGDYWVDRPPLLVALTALAAHAGGVVALRLIGLLAVVVTVVACSAAAGRVAGDRAARWAAAAAAVLTVSPWLGADRVNGELLATPWIALGIYAAIRAVETPRLGWGVATGAAIAGAVLTKQNHADAAVFAVVLLAAGAATGRVRPVVALRLASGALLGGLLVVAVVLLAAWTRGTAPADLFDALVSFRLRAADVMAADPEGAKTHRQTEMLLRALVGGQLVLAAGVLAAPLWRRLRSPAAVAVSAAVAFGCLSVLAGGSWWNHYLVELAAPVAVGTGLVAARTRVVVPALLAYAAAAAVVGAVLVRPVIDTADGPVAAGRMIADAAEPGDTVVNAWGRPDLVLASGLDSPYEHLWSLPIRTDDARLEAFGALVAGPDAPTWLVFRDSLDGWGMEHEAAQRTVESRYREVATVCGYGIWLVDGTERSVPTPPRDVRCKASTWLR
ncbi:hypothetical protein AFL01nite_13990 [Aeromicrobium flavum]|uniref:Glycosyltransferase RgtA/B/C/D-like domain-containing protein n=1 Tax=Aeromicrobium flavum TaxID=416568 RepID=A0A512HUE2_9ACTN|nr:glycosyltransferase family 39 protein [Aeromicrobium flavum]GEO89072.1 hypothetical protein AFL01nite_13990 [Aeromicrobium flavum]